MPASSLIEKKTSVTAGALKVSDAYDLSLSKMPSGDYEIMVFMKIQFFFKNNTPYVWKPFERTQFMKDWESAIRKSWGGRILKRLSTGNKVFLNFSFKIQQGGWMFDNWEITVTKIKAGGFARSYVVPSMGNVALDSEDLTPVSKAPSFKQRGAVHEFGHMLGLLDEYKKSKYVSDTGSVMHSGEMIRPRHDAPIIKWMNHVLTVNKIK